MSRRQAARPGLRTILLIVMTTAVPLAILLWAGKLLFDQNRILFEQQTRDRLARATDAVVSALQAAITDTERRLAAGETMPGMGSAMVTFASAGVSVEPAAAVAFVPGLRTPDVQHFRLDRADQLEFGKADFAAASQVLRHLADSPAPESPVRAEALVRLARNLQRQERWREAAAALDRLAEFSDVRLTAGPAAVVAAYLRARAHETAGDQSQLRQAARELERAMVAAGAALTPAQYANYRQDAERWLGRPIDQGDRLLLAKAVELLWDRWREGAGPGAGRQVLEIDGRTVTALRPSSVEARRVLLATETFAANTWWPSARTAAGQANVELAIGEPRGAGGGAFDGPPAIYRTPAEADLPWSVTVTPTEAFIDAAGFERRRNLLAAGFALVVVLALGASFFTARSVARELAVARLQSDFVAAVSHEFRTPLTTLRQFTDMLREQDGPDAAARRVCYDAQSRAAERLTRLVESVLDLGRMEAGARVYRLASHDAGAVIAQVVDDFRRHAAPAGYVVTLEQRGTGAVAIDPEAFSRAVWNLLENAVKYSPHDRQVQVSVERNHDRLVVAVRDRGIGIPQHEHAAVFGRFRRGEAASALGLPGTGIGLAMVDHIVRGHGGEIRLVSAAGQGSTFSIVLPVSSSTQES